MEGFLGGIKSREHFKGEKAGPSRLSPRLIVYGSVLSEPVKEKGSISFSGETF